MNAGAEAYGTNRSSLPHWQILKTIPPCSVWLEWIILNHGEETNHEELALARRPVPQPDTVQSFRRRLAELEGTSYAMRNALRAWDAAETADGISKCSCSGACRKSVDPHLRS